MPGRAHKTRPPTFDSIEDAKRLCALKGRLYLRLRDSRGLQRDRRSRQVKAMLSPWHRTVSATPPLTHKPSLHYVSYLCIVSARHLMTSLPAS